MRCSQRDNPVTGERASLHPIGQPIIHSRNRGLTTQGIDCPGTPFPKLKRTPGPEGDLRRRGAGTTPSSSSSRRRAMWASTAPSIPSWFSPWTNFGGLSIARIGQLPGWLTRGVGQNEEPGPKVGRADFSRAE